MKLIILITVSTTWFIFNTDLHNTSWCIIQCKNVHFCTGFISVTLSCILFKSQTFSLSDLDSRPLPHLPACPISVLTCPNMHLSLWTSYFRWLSLWLTAWLPAPPWFESLQFSHVGRWVAGQCHVHCSSHLNQRKIVQVDRSVLQLKLQVSRNVLNPPRYCVGKVAHSKIRPFSLGISVQQSPICTP